MRPNLLRLIDAPSLQVKILEINTNCQIELVDKEVNKFIYILYPRVVPCQQYINSAFLKSTNVIPGIFKTL